MLIGGVVPGGMVRSRVWLMAVTSALAAPMLASGWKKTRIRPTPASDCDSMCSMLLTVVVIARSEMVTIRPSTSFGESPLNCQMTEMTGMLISGKMSMGVRAIVSTPPMAMSIAMTMKVYGRRRARRTIHMASENATPVPLDSEDPRVVRTWVNQRFAEGCRCPDVLRPAFRQACRNIGTDDGKGDRRWRRIMTASVEIVGLALISDGRPIGPIVAEVRSLAG